MTPTTSATRTTTLPARMGGLYPRTVRVVGTQAVEEITAAARTTLAAGSARVHARVFSDPPRPPDRDRGSGRGGVTDCARRRTRVEQRSTGRGWESIGARLVERWPWLEEIDGGEQDGEDDEPLSMT